MEYGKQKYLLINNLPKELIEKLEEYKVIIAGGAIRSVFSGEPISDYDLYFKKKEDADKLIKYFENKDYELCFLTESAKTYKIDKTLFQIILLESTFLPSAKEIIDNFDFTICMGAYDTFLNQFILHPNFLLDLASRNLVYNVNAKFPLCSLYRVGKYVRRGYHISGVEIIKLGLSINNLKMDNYQDLKEQLVGIDTLFLKDLTDKLMTPEYIEKKFDFNEFLDMIDEYYNKSIEEILQ